MDLEDLAGDVEGQVGGVDDALHEGQVARHQVLIELIADEDALHKQPDVPALLHPVLQQAHTCMESGQLQHWSSGDQPTGRRLFRWLCGATSRSHLPIVPCADSSM